MLYEKVYPSKTILIVIIFYFLLFIIILYKFYDRVKKYK